MRLALLCLVVACGSPQIQERKLADLAKLGPASLEATRPREGDPREAKVRVWADAGMRALPGWKDKINDQLDYAGQLLTPLVGVRLKVTKWQEWERTGVLDPVEAARALAEVDDGKEVAWVFGFIAPGESASKAMGELGHAELLGKHVVVRAWAARPETDALASTLPDLEPAQRVEVLAAHERHKQSVVLLHMLGRTLGAIGETDPTWIQNPIYSPKMSTVSDRNRALMQLAVDGRLSDDELPRIAHDLLEKVEQENWGGWIGPSRDETVAQLRAIVTAGKAGQAAANVPGAAVEQFERIKALAQRGDTQTALAELENLLVAYPGNATMFQLRCDIHLVKPGVQDKATRQVCARAAEVAPDDPRPNFAVADALLRAGDLAGAHAELQTAATKIASLKTGAEQAWQRLVATYNDMGALTWTEQALARSQLADDATAASVAATRARYGIPKGTKAVKPADEAALVKTIREVLPMIYANKYGEAQKALDAADKKWPNAAGLAGARCDLELRKNNVPAARAACNKALAADPDASWALYLSAVIALKDTSPASTRQGIDKLRRAIAVDPDLGQAWRTLAKAYVRAKDASALEQLGKDYQARFGSPLPLQ
jgi:tetratricopeptide (TPR) repeat protein